MAEQKNDLVYLMNTKEKVYLQHDQTKVVVISPKEIVLPSRPENQTQITLFNHSGNTILIDTNSVKDLIHSQFYAPQGSQSIYLEANRMLTLKYITVSESIKKPAYWHIILS